MEVEIKARVENPEELKKTLELIGAKIVKEKYEKDMYFSHPCRDFSETDEALRIRNDFTLTYKGPKVDEDTKSREEHYITVSDIEKTRLILEKLGFREVAVVEKVRKYYQYGDLTICLDDVKGLGTFVEIECMGEYSECKRAVLEFAEKLKIKNFIRKSYLEMLLESQR